MRGTWPPDDHHVWLSDAFSVPARTLCLNQAESPNSDHYCVRAHDHPGKHEYTMNLDARAYGFKDRPQ